MVNMGMETSISVNTAITGGQDKTYTLGSVLYDNCHSL